MPKILFNLYITQEQLNYVKKKADALQRSQASIVREMIAKEMKAQCADK